MHTRAPSSLPLLLALATAACSPAPVGSEDSDADSNTTTSEGDEAGNTALLEEACDSPADDPGWGSLDRDSDGALTVDDLEPGEAAMQAIWTAPSGTKTVWRQVSTTANVWHGDGNGDQTRYGVWLPLTDPENMQPLYTTAVFEGPIDGVAEAGSFTRVASSWDIAYLERGGSNETEPGAVEFSYVEGDIASGSVSAPSGPIEIIDYIQQAPSGDIVCVQAIVFREISAEFTH